MASLHYIDYAIFILIIIGSFSIGVYYALTGKNKTTDEYLMAGHKMTALPVAVSFLISSFSAIAIIGDASEIYYYGIEYAFTSIGLVIPLFIFRTTYVPLMFPLKLTSIHEYIFMRYNSKELVYFATTVKSVSHLFYNGIVLFAASIVLESYADIPVWLCILVIGTVATVYTSIGGFRAVIWSDVFQTVVFFVGLVAINTVGIIKVGGIKATWNIFREQGRSKINWSFSPFERSTPWNYGLYMIVTGIVHYGSTQMALQRYCSLPTLKLAKRSVVYAAIPYTITTCLTCLSGVVAFTYFTHIGCDPLRAGQISNPNQIIPYFLKEVLAYPPLPGLFLACVACATLSNLSTVNNSLTALVWEDILKDKSGSLTEIRKTLITKCVAFIVGILTIILAFAVSQLHGTLMQICFTIGMCIGTPVFLFITLGALSTKTSSKSVAIGGLITFAITMWLGLGRTFSGTSSQMLHTTVTNCTFNNMDPNISTYGNYSYDLFNDDVTEGNYVTDSLTGHNSTNRQLGDHITEEKNSIFVLYKISYVLILPIGVLTGTLVALIISYIPVFKNNDKVDPKLLFPCVRYLKGQNVSNGFQNVPSELHLT